ncbi:MAG: two-component sensor histidine kinase [Propionibacteriales bacterium]|nr:two-component sensor histidine kinase [Propionibacteriales bacterium]
MDTSTAAVLGGLVGAALVAATMLAFRLSERDHERTPEAVTEPTVPPGVAAVLSVLRSSAMVVGPDDAVLKASAPARAMGLLQGSDLAVEELLDLVRQVRRDGQIRESDLVLRTGRARALQVAARVAPLGSRLILVLVEDRTKERRVEAIRRDFVANVSHELKTPVGALNLLAEAVGEAADDPEAVQRFSMRMRTESERLTRLVQQIIELSRLQGDEPFDDADPIAAQALAERAIDRVKVDAADKGVQLQYVGDNDIVVFGQVEELVVALGNLIENAVVYSQAGTRVTLTAHIDGDMVDLVVTDQGVGIPAAEIDRIFERFYRVDPARARSTGGTGLGLSIVKHVAATHGGEVRVWSVEGEGSTFTLSLPGSKAPTPTTHLTTNRGAPTTRTLTREETS